MLYSIDVKTCVQPKKTMTPSISQCTTIMFALYFASELAGFWYELRTDTRKSGTQKRAFIYHERTLYDSFNRTADQGHCDIVFVHIDPRVSYYLNRYFTYILFQIKQNQARDKQTPIVFELSYGLLNPEPSEFGIKPILGDMSPKTSKAVSMKPFSVMQDVIPPSPASVST
jgi:hypothetical protein